jgi:hypothetical protein
MIIHREGCEGIRCDCNEDHPKTLKEHLEQLKQKQEEAEYLIKENKDGIA